ncbi:MAG: phosphoglycerate mutase family protein [Firmicutes bacterium]|jgi:2,3-bisphosphoglycerate-dependent phosphoglycerate mutase|nr:phosphoglycerate mutase family protein [Bacillota bacterium]
MAKVYFLRHGSFKSIPNNEFGGKLTSVGRSKAKKVHNLLKEKGVDSIYSSPCLWTIETVEELAMTLDKEINIVDDFNERLLSGSQADYDRDMIEKLWSDWDFSFEGGESNFIAQSRAVKQLDTILKESKDETFVVSTHGHLITLILNHFDKRIGYEFCNALKEPDLIYAEFEEGKMTDFRRMI